MIIVREATGRDVPAIRDVFLATYANDYSDPRYYDEGALTRMVYSDESLLLVAEDESTGRVVGTASVILEVGAYSDLVGEFGRLAVHPEARARGIGGLLMAERLRRVEGRLQVGLVDARIVDAYSSRIAEAHGFAPVGFFPLAWQLRDRESLLLLARYFGGALGLRKNHPRIVPEVAPLAHTSLDNCGLAADVIVDEGAPPYPPGGAFDLDDLKTEGYAPLLRIERGRVQRREIFGPVRLHEGLFMLQSRRARYLIAREGGRVAGAIGFTHSTADRTVRIFELIALHDGVVRPLLAALERASQEDWGACFLEADVSAFAPRMQRTLIELGFLPAGYVPALAFLDVERLDVVKMARLLVPPDVSTERLPPRSRALADLVLGGFRSRAVLPRIAAAVRGLSLFEGLADEQVRRLAGMCTVASFPSGAVIYREGQTGAEMYLLLRGTVSIAAGAAGPVGIVQAGECLGEVSLLTGGDHSATATAATEVEAARLSQSDVAELVRLRPDIGLLIYRNLAIEIGQKLRRSSARSFHPP